MKRYMLITALLCIGQALVLAQIAERQDTILLSVYNNGLKFRLTPATFGQRTPSEDLLAEMVAAYDTVVTFVEETPSPIANNNPTADGMLLEKAQKSDKIKVLKIGHQCGKFEGEVQGKVVVMTLNPLCDVTQTALLAQKAGAKAIIFQHYSNERDSIVLKTGVYADSVKMPCYTVRRERGEQLMSMLPSQVGIKKPDGMPDDALGLVAKKPTNNEQAQQKQGDKMAENAQNDLSRPLGTEGVATGQVGSITQMAHPDISGKEITLENPPQMRRNEIDLSPNPSDDVATLRYALKTATDLTVAVLNEAGQIVASYQAKQTQFGSLNLNTHQWASGIYMVHLVGKAVKEVKRFVVQH